MPDNTSPNTEQRKSNLIGESEFNETSSDNNEIIESENKKSNDSIMTFGDDLDVPAFIRNRQS